MYVKRDIHPRIILYFAWKDVLFSTILSAGVVLAYKLGATHALAIPFLPIATVGTAVAFYVGFKNNASYERLWEARKIWGEFTNLSRAIASYLIAVARTAEGKKATNRFVYRQIAYANMLRLLLRRKNVWDDSHAYTLMASKCFANRPYEEEAAEVLRTFCADQAADVLTKLNAPSYILGLQMSELARFQKERWIDGFEQSDLLRMITELYAQQGKAERIKNFPFPRQYAYFSEVFANIFVFLLPFGLIGEFAKLGDSHVWLTIPFSVLIAWIFITMEQVGDTSENPFEGSLNDVPMTAICRVIEINLKELLGETELPEQHPVVDHILM